eukprot:g35127.t1
MVVKEEVKGQVLHLLRLHGKVPWEVKWWNTLSTAIHYKATDFHCYLHDSLSLQSCKDTISFSQFLHYSYAVVLRCNTSPFISSLLTIQGPKRSFQVKQHFTCTSSSLVNYIRQCDLLYIGETKCRLGDRFAEHLWSMCKQDPDLPAAGHFNTAS